jgi:hypothetical protein
VGRDNPSLRNKEAPKKDDNIRKGTEVSFVSECQRSPGMSHLLKQLMNSSETDPLLMISSFQCTDVTELSTVAWPHEGAKRETALFCGGYLDRFHISNLFDV